MFFLAFFPDHVSKYSFEIIENKSFSLVLNEQFFSFIKKLLANREIHSSLKRSFFKLRKFDATLKLLVIFFPEIEISLEISFCNRRFCIIESLNCIAFPSFKSI